MPQVADQKVTLFKMILYNVRDSCHQEITSLNEIQELSIILVATSNVRISNTDTRFASLLVSKLNSEVPPANNSFFSQRASTTHTPTTSFGNFTQSICPSPSLLAHQNQSFLSIADASDRERTDRSPSLPPHCR
jgi:hypothetical protein